MKFPRRLNLAPVIVDGILARIDHLMSNELDWTMKSEASYPCTGCMRFKYWSKILI
jgi:hypothetical protein